MTERLIRLSRDDEGREVAVVKAGVVCPRVQYALLPAPLDTFVYHLTNAQQSHLQCGKL